MTDIQKYEFDRLGYLVLPGFLTSAETQTLATAIDALEEHAAAHVKLPPRKTAAWGSEYHLSLIHI